MSDQPYGSVVKGLAAKAWVLAPRPTWWKEKTNSASCPLTFMCACVHTYFTALAVQGPSILTDPAHGTSGNKEDSSFLDSIFWMAAPKNRRTIEVNRCRRRNSWKLIKVKNNIDVCPECGHLKQKHVLCGYCYEKVRKETTQIRQQIWTQEGGPFKAPTVETVVLYTGEKPSERDQGKRIVERNMKRPSWFTQNWHWGS